MLEVVASNQVFLDGRPSTWADLIGQGDRVGLPGLLAGFNGPAALVSHDLASAFIAIAALASSRRDGLLVGSERLSTGVRDVLRQAGFSLCLIKSGEATAPVAGAPAVPGRISLLTSGSTGIPKLVGHRWETLFTGRRIKSIQPRRWLVPYQPGTYAWYQIVTLGLFQEAQALVAADPSDMERLFTIAAETRVDSISATPTFWRLALMGVPQESLRALPLQQITLGGETVDQSILDQLRELYPSVQLTHIYASTESGTCIIVKDGRAGFPARMLDRNDPALPQLKVEDGRLWVQSPFSASAAAGDTPRWIDSGDLVDLRDGRVYFVGRADAALINVGGNKAYPADIEAVLLKHPAIRWCRVRALRALLVGHLPEAEVLCDEPAPSDAELTQFCQGKLPEYAVPRIWSRVSVIPVQSSLKAAL